jgi:hypothetical protein
MLELLDVEQANEAERDKMLAGNDFKCRLSG